MCHPLWESVDHILPQYLEHEPIDTIEHEGKSRRAPALETESVPTLAQGRGQELPRDELLAGGPPGHPYGMEAPRGEIQVFPSQDGFPAAAGSRPERRRRKDDKETVQKQTNKSQRHPTKRGTW